MKKWTQGRIKAFIIAVLRGGSRKWPPKYETLNEAFTGRKINKKTKRLAKHYLCNACQKEFVATEIEIDHINPVVDPKKGFTTWDDFINRLFCTKENLQALCKECHKIKTRKEQSGN